MAIVLNNDLILGLRGSLGKSVVFRTYGGRTIVSSRPRPSKTQSESQRATRSRFQDATRFAKICMRDPVRKAYYQRKAKAMNLPNAYTAAITEYMRGGVGVTSGKPQVSSIPSVGGQKKPQVEVAAHIGDMMLASFFCNLPGPRRPSFAATFAKATAAKHVDEGFTRRRSDRGQGRNRAQTLPLATNISSLRDDLKNRRICLQTFGPYGDLIS